jgi:lipopolysaccharide biosynthesis glycosyltransferase
VTLHVACAIEREDYVAHSAAMLHSVLVHSGRLAVRIHYLHPPELPVDVRAPLAEMVERHGGSISFLEIPDERVVGLPVEGFTLKATWYRAFLPELLPDVERILFLDADLIAVDSLEPLWETELGEHHVAAVTNVFLLGHLPRTEELGLESPQDYFNAGVLLMNLDLMRRNGSMDEVIEYGRKHARNLTFRDQDAMNVVLGDRRLSLHPRWNCMNAVVRFPYTPYVLGSRATEEARRSPAIRHFEGPERNKPWHILCDFPHRELYFHHREQTPWPHVRLEGVTPRNVLKRIAGDLRHRPRSVPSLLGRGARRAFRA